MSEFDEIMKVISFLNSENISLKALAQEEILSMSVDAIPYLNQAKKHPHRWPSVDVYQMLACIGDDLFAAGGITKVEHSIIESMKLGATNNSIMISPQIKPLATEALIRWGLLEMSEYPSLYSEFMQ